MSQKVSPRTALDYKKHVCNSFIPLCPDDIDAKLAGEKFFVTRKYDGELAIIVVEDEMMGIYNARGKPIDVYPPALKELVAAVDAADIDGAFACELYVDESAGRTKVGDVRAVLADSAKHDTLRLAPFDIVGLYFEGDKASTWKSAHYGDTHAKLTALFGKTKLCQPVRMKEASSKAEVKKLFDEWVTKEGAEGLVVHSELPLVYKIKPQYTIDAAVVGFSEGDVKNQIRALLLGLARDDGTWQIIGRCGTGFTDDERATLYEKLSKAVVSSSYVETDSNHVAFRMVKPEVVIEVTAHDIAGDNNDGVIRNPVITIETETVTEPVEVCKTCGTTPGVSLTHPVFSRIRDDKKPNKDDTRVAQITDHITEPQASGATAEMPKSKLLKREVYKKISGDKLMAQKFMVWQTNKTDFGYPAFVFAYTNFSSDRAEPLQTEMRVSNSEEQVTTFYAEFITKNVKKGWEKV